MARHDHYTSNRKLNDKIRMLVRDHGWTAAYHRKHIKLRSPDGAIVVVGRTISDGHGVLNALAFIKRVQQGRAPAAPHARV